MSIPFSVEQFLEIFRTYNEAVWPVQVILNLIALFAVYSAVRPISNSGKILSSILAFLWLWMGVVYHLLYFTAINKAAYAFGVLYILQAGIFLYFGMFKHSLSFRFRADLPGLTGVVFLLYGLVIYPLLGSWLGHSYPHSPTFGLPCPTTIFTFGVLLWTETRIPTVVLIIPLLWSIIGFTAALSLGIKEDIGLLVAGIAGSVLLLRRNRRGGAIGVPGTTRG